MAKRDNPSSRVPNGYDASSSSVAETSAAVIGLPSTFFAKPTFPVVRVAARSAAARRHQTLVRLGLALERITRMLSGSPRNLA
jgi:hypothetical protein